MAYFYMAPLDAYDLRIKFFLFFSALLLLFLIYKYFLTDTHTRIFL